MKGVKIQEIEHDDFVYDIEVEDNHNFFSEDILVHNCFISLAPKMYYCRIFDNEGVKLTEPKLKITGLSMIRSNTPSFFRKKLKPILPMLLENDIDSLMTYIKEVKNEMYSIKPSSLAINVSVSSLNYTWNSAKNTYQKWNGSKFLSCPINSRAALKHNEFIEKTKSREMIKDIYSGDKISYINLIQPNPAGTEVFAFKDSRVFNIENLKENIDYLEMFNKQFMTNIKLITDPLGIELIESEFKINEDDW